MNPLFARTAGSSAINPTYEEVLRDDFGASEVWPLVDIESGTVIPAFVNSARNGTLSGWELQNADGPVEGTLAPLSDGASDHGNILTSGGGVGLADIFNGAELSLFAWARVANAGVWTDGVFREILRLTADAQNLVRFSKVTNSNVLEGLYRAGNVTEIVTTTFSDTDWFSLGLSVSDSADQMKFFVNGSQVGSTQTGIGTFAGTLTLALIGAVTAAPTLVWNGWLAYIAVRFGSIWTPSNFTDMHSTAF